MKCQVCNQKLISKYCVHITQKYKIYYYYNCDLVSTVVLYNGMILLDLKGIVPLDENKIDMYLLLQ